jgi:hypothetical protein
LTWLTDPNYVAAASAFLTFVGTGVLIALSIWLKRRICHGDKHMKRKKRLIEELYNAAVAAVLLCLVATTQFVLTGGLLAVEPGKILIDRPRLELLERLAFLTIIAGSILVGAAGARVTVSRYDILIDRDTVGRQVAQDLRTPMPRMKKRLAITMVASALAVFFYVVTDVFIRYATILRS